MLVISLFHTWVSRTHARTNKMKQRARQSEVKLKEVESEGLVKGSQHATPSNTKEAEATSETNRVKQKDGNSKVTMSCHFGVRKRLHHHTQLQLLRSMLCHTMFMS